MFLDSLITFVLAESSSISLFFFSANKHQHSWTEPLKISKVAKIYRYIEIVKCKTRKDMVQQIRNFFYNTETFVWTRDEGPGGRGRANSFSHHANVCDGVFEGGKSRPAPARVPYRDDYVISYHVYMVNLCEGQGSEHTGHWLQIKLCYLVLVLKRTKLFLNTFVACVADSLNPR